LHWSAAHGVGPFQGFTERAGPELGASFRIAIPAARGSPRECWLAGQLFDAGELIVKG
jgi:hypothetical protein